MEVRRTSKIEVLDEIEEWELIMVSLYAAVGCERNEKNETKIRRDFLQRRKSAP